MKFNMTCHLLEVWMPQKPDPKIIFETIKDIFVDNWILICEFNNIFFL